MVRREAQGCLLAILSVAVTLIIGSCQSTSDQLSSPVATPTATGIIVASPKASQFAELSLGIIYSAGYLKADRYSGGRLSPVINNVLTGRFAQLVRGFQPKKAKESGANLLVYLDAKASYSMGILDTGEAHITATVNAGVKVHHWPA